MLTLLYQQHNLEIFWDATDKWLNASWTGRLSEEDIKRGGDQLLRLMVARNTDSLLDDHLRVEAEWPGGPEWRSKDWLPRMRAAGLRNCAGVFAKKNGNSPAEPTKIRRFDPFLDDGRCRALAAGTAQPQYHHATDRPPAGTAGALRLGRVYHRWVARREGVAYSVGFLLLCRAFHRPLSALMKLLPSFFALLGLAAAASAAPVILNEYNAGGATDVEGDWFEIVVVGGGAAGDVVDMRGWEFSIDESRQPGH